MSQLSPRFVVREQLSRRASARLILEIEIAERLPVGIVAHNEASAVRFIDRSRRWEVALLY